MAILERDEHLARLHCFAREAAAGNGRLVFIGGEMGIGKSTLVEAFRRETSAASQMTIVSCDGLPDHSALGPLFDKARAIGPEVSDLLESGAPRDQVFRAVEAGLRRASGLTILVGEDAQWADEASLDLLAFLGRRIGTLPALFIATYRDDESPPEHPLRRVLGDLATAPAVRRIILPPFSIGAITEIAAGSGMDPVELLDYTGGNPFFVTEIVNAGIRTPVTIQDAILARAARISTMARTTLDMAAVMGLIFDPGVLQSVVGGSIGPALEQGLDVGLLKPADHGLRFRHSTVRDAILRTISPVRKRALHRQIYQQLSRDPRFRHDDARLSYHAEEAGDRENAFTHATGAARQAAAYRSHREAAAHYARALRNADGEERELKATLLEAGAYECSLTGNISDAIAQQMEAVTIRRALAEALPLGDSTCLLARYRWLAGETSQAAACAHEALEILAPYPDRREMALASTIHAQLLLQANNLDEAATWADGAIALAESLNDHSIQADALTTMGVATCLRGDAGGSALILQAADVARRHGLDDALAQALASLAWSQWAFRRIDSAQDYLHEGIILSADRDLMTINLSMRALQASIHLARCQWDAARDIVAPIARNPLASPDARVVALTVLGLGRIRQGGTGGTELDEALDLAERSGAPRSLATSRAARAEAAWLVDDLATASAEVEAGFASVRSARNSMFPNELAIWGHRSGTGIDLRTDAVSGPFQLEIEGRWQDAAAAWSALGFPLEEARARANATDETSLREALATLDHLGARADAARLASRMRALGYRHIPRGPRPSTRAAHATLTTREIEVLARVASGETNGEIAARFYLSRRTIEHHVSSILGKLGASTREEAADKAREAGLVPG